MARIRFDGNIDALSDTQRKFVEDIFVERGFNDTTISITAVGKAGDNYVANVIRLSAEKDGITFKTVAKVAPANETIRQMMSTVIMFTNESVMYTQVLPKFEEIQENAGIPQNERFRFPACYGYLPTVPHEMVLLEDIKEAEFFIFDRLVSLSNKSVKIALASLAQFHSLSFVLKRQEPDTFVDFTGKLINSWAVMNNHEQSKLHFELLEQDVITILENEKHKKIVEGSISQILSLATQLQIVEADPKYTVIQHGDCWTNNLMFRLNGDEVVENILIDYQLSKSANPADDLHYLILNCTDYEIRSKNYFEWIDHYHSELDRNLAQFNLKAETVYPREQLDHDLKKHSKLGLALALLLSSVQVRGDDDIMDVRSEENSEGWNENPMEALESFRITNINKESSDRFVKKAAGIIDSVTEWGYL